MNVGAIGDACEVVSSQMRDAAVFPLICGENQLYSTPRQLRRRTIGRTWETNMGNPADSYYRTREGAVVETRNVVFSCLEEKSPRLAGGARKILERKLGASTIPTLGELVPWMLADLFETEVAKAREVAVGWLQIYLYTSLLDDLLDNHRVPEADELLSGSVMFQDGLLRLQKLLAGTGYEEALTEALISAADYQILDVTSRSLKDPQLKHEVAAGKNLVLMACAVPMCAHLGGNTSVAVKAVKSILCALQFFDDIKDWQEDYKAGNYTKLMSMAYRKLSEDSNETIEFEELGRDDVLANLISTGALGDLLTETRDVIRNSVFALPLGPKAVTSSAYLFFVEMDRRLGEAILNVKRAREILSLPRDETFADTLVGVEKALKQIAQSS